MNPTQLTNDNPAYPVKVYSAGVLVEEDVVLEGTVLASGGAGKVTLFWDECAGATQYNIYRYDAAKQAYVYTATAYNITYTDTKVTAGTRYSYKIVSVTKTADLTLVSAKSEAAEATARD